MLFEQKLDIILQTVTEWAIQGHGGKTKIYEEPTVNIIIQLLDSIPKDSYTPFLGGILDIETEKLLVWKRETLTHDEVLKEAGITKPICCYIGKEPPHNDNGKKYLIAVSAFSGVCLGSKKGNYKDKIPPEIAEKILLQHPSLKELLSIEII